MAVPNAREIQVHESSPDEGSPTSPSVVILASVLVSILLGLCCYLLLRL